MECGRSVRLGSSFCFRRRQRTVIWMHAEVARKFVTLLACMLLLITLQTPPALDSCTQSSVGNIIVSITPFRWINSSTSQATCNTLIGTPRPPHDGIGKCDETLFLAMLHIRCLRTLTSESLYEDGPTLCPVSLSRLRLQACPSGCMCGTEKVVRRDGGWTKSCMSRSKKSMTG